MISKKRRRIIFVPLALVTITLASWLAMDLYKENAYVQKIKGVDGKVIKQLKKLRVAQKAYLAVNNKYCGDWHELFDFIDSANFYTIQQIEEVTQLANGQDSITVHIDTIGVFPVYDSLKHELDLRTKKDIVGLAVVPVSDTLFTLRADVSDNGQNICEIRDPKPLNPRRQKNGDLQPLQIGSLTVSTLRGNWE